MSTLEEKYSYAYIDGKRFDKSHDYTAARNSLGTSVRMRLAIYGPTGQFEQVDIGLNRTLKNLVVDYNPSNGKCTLTEKCLYEGSLAALNIPFPSGEIGEGILINNSGIEIGRINFARRLYVEKNKKVDMNFANLISYSFDQDSKEILIHDQSTSGVYVPLLISVVNAKTANAFYSKNDKDKPVVVKHADMDTVLAADYSTVNTGITIAGNNVGDINIKGTFQSDCSAFTAYLDVDKVLFFRISDVAKTRDFKLGTEVDFWLTSTGTVTT